MLLLENLYGDIISDLCAAFVADWAWCRARISDTNAPSSKRTRSAPDIAGKDIPTYAVLRSGILMLPISAKRMPPTTSVWRWRRLTERTHVTRRGRHRRHQRVCRRHGRGAAHIHSSRSCTKWSCKRSGGKDVTLSTASPGRHCCSVVTLVLQRPSCGCPTAAPFYFSSRLLIGKCRCPTTFCTSR